MERWERPHEAGRRAWESTPAGRRVGRIVNAARTEAGEIRYEAEEAARTRLRAAEYEARRTVEQARQSAEEMVLGRLRRLSDLNAEIHERYRGIVQGLDRFESASAEARLLVEGLDRATGRLRQEARQPAEATPIRSRRPGLATDATVDRVQ